MHLPVIDTVRYYNGTVPRWVTKNKIACRSAIPAYTPCTLANTLCDTEDIPGLNDMHTSNANGNSGCPLNIGIVRGWSRRYKTHFT